MGTQRKNHSPFQSGWFEKQVHNRVYLLSNAGSNSDSSHLTFPELPIFFPKENIAVLCSSPRLCLLQVMKVGGEDYNVFGLNAIVNFFIPKWKQLSNVVCKESEWAEVISLISVHKYYQTQLLYSLEKHLFTCRL